MWQQRCPAMSPARTCHRARASCADAAAPAVAGCNVQLVEAPAQDLPIIFDHVVTGIDYSEASIAAHIAKQTFTGARALSTQMTRQTLVSAHDDALHCCPQPRPQRLRAGQGAPQNSCALRCARSSLWRYAANRCAAEAALVTVPLGVLKAGSIRFQPPLPPRKQDAIATWALASSTTCREDGCCPEVEELQARQWVLQLPSCCRTIVHTE